MIPPFSEKLFNWTLCLLHESHTKFPHCLYKLKIIDDYDDDDDDDDDDGDNNDNGNINQNSQLKSKFTCNDAFYEIFQMKIHTACKI